MPTLSASALTNLLSLRRVVNNASSVKRLRNNSRVTNNQTSRIMWTNIQSMMFGSSSSSSSERPAKGNSDPAEDVIESLRKLATSAERAHNRYPLPKILLRVLVFIRQFSLICCSFPHICRVSEYLQLFLQIYIFSSYFLTVAFPRVEKWKGFSQTPMQ